MNSNNLSVVGIIVSYDDPAATYEALKSLHDQSHKLTEVLIVDNHPEARTVAAAKEWDLPARILTPGKNLGYAGGSIHAAQATQADWLFFLNPDAVADSCCVERLVSSLTPQTAIVGAQVLLPDQETVNAGDNPVHISGLSWSGRYGMSREEGPARETFAVSGAALLLNRKVFTELGMYREGTFMYYDDVDLAWRAQLAGWNVCFCPQATVVHDYGFEKGKSKWYWLERNRLWAVLSYYQWETLLLFIPVLLAVEVAVAMFAWRSGWLKLKLRVYRSLWSHRKELADWREEFQKSRKVNDLDLIQRLDAAFSTTLIKLPAASFFNKAIACYKRLTLFVLNRNADKKR